MGMEKIIKSAKFILKEDFKCGKINISETFTNNSINQKLILELFEKLKNPASYSPTQKGNFTYKIDFIVFFLHGVE